MAYQPVAGPPKASAKQTTDLKYLEKRSPSRGTPIPPAAMLSIPQLLEVERLAFGGMNLNQIAKRLRIRDDIWEQIIKHNASVKEAYEEGYTRLQELACQKLVDGILGGEPALLRLAADRGMLGPQWESKNKPVVSVTTGHAPIQIDVIKSADDAFERQRLLLIESEAVEVGAEAD